MRTSIKGRSQSDFLSFISLIGNLVSTVTASPAVPPLTHLQLSVPLKFRAPRWHQLVLITILTIGSFVMGILLHGWLSGKWDTYSPAEMAGRWCVFLLVGWFLPTNRLELTAEGFTTSTGFEPALVPWSALKSLSIRRNWFRDCGRHRIYYEYLSPAPLKGNSRAAIKKKYLPSSYGVSPERLAEIMSHYWHTCANTRHSPAPKA